mmetsp:Transcript_82718/g.233791  ORF Transcript_82718/g.233791 Transcript_82718/m.233791 type:complete len:201 (+) Transcript_82718:726-1328(+)
MTAPLPILTTRSAGSNQVPPPSYSSCELRARLIERTLLSACVGWCAGLTGSPRYLIKRESYTNMPPPPVVPPCPPSSPPPPRLASRLAKRLAKRSASPRRSPLTPPVGADAGQRPSRMGKSFDSRRLWRSARVRGSSWTCMSLLASVSVKDDLPPSSFCSSVERRSLRDSNSSIIAAHSSSDRMGCELKAARRRPCASVT